MIRFGHPISTSKDETWSKHPEAGTLEALEAGKKGGGEEDFFLAGGS